MRRVCNHLSTTGDTIYLPDQLKCNRNAFVIQYRLNTTFRNVNIDDPRNFIGFYHVNNESAPPPSTTNTRR